MKPNKRGKGLPFNLDLRKRCDYCDTPRTGLDQFNICPGCRSFIKQKRKEIDG